MAARTESRALRWWGLRLRGLVGAGMAAALLVVAGCGGTGGTPGAESKGGDAATAAQPAKGTEQAARPAGDRSRPVVFGVGSWDSAAVHAEIARYIVEKGYGYKTEAVPGDGVPLLTGLRRGDVEVLMELWADNFKDVYDQAIAAKEILDLGPNFPDAVQGWFVPTYVVKGDPARNIKAVAPDLKSVKDLVRYKDLFKDPEQPDKGRLVNCPASWGCNKVNSNKLQAYGLDKSFVGFQPGSDAALATSLVSAYEKGQPWVGYYWGPSWIYGKFDLTLLEEPAYSEDCWKGNQGCAYPTARVQKVVHKGLAERAPDVTEFLRKYQTTTKMVSEALAYMNDQKADARATALWFLKQKQDVWTKWVPDEVAQKVKNSL